MARMNLRAIKFSKVYPMYLQKVQRKGRTKEELDAVIEWLTGYDTAGLANQIARDQAHTPGNWWKIRDGASNIGIHDFSNQALNQISGWLCELGRSGHVEALKSATGAISGHCARSATIGRRSYEPAHFLKSA